MKFDILKINEEVENKNISRQKHPTKDLWIYKYTINCVFKKQWNDITLSCRGLVMDADGNVVSNPMPKFFNVEEVPNVAARMAQGHSYKITDKMDGSLIMVFKHEGDVEVSSSGSLDSPQARKAREMLAEKYPDFVVEDGLTYVFEIIYPENRIVLDYGDHEGLTLLAIRETDTGLERELSGVIPVVETIDKTLDEIRAEQTNAEFINKEGYVVAFSSGHDLYRVKVKFNEYMRLHKIVSGVNEKYIWECCRDGKDMKEILDAVPDEMYNWISNYHLKLQTEKARIYNKGLETFEKLKKEYPVRKDFSRVVLEEHEDQQALLFAFMSEWEEENIEGIIWKQLIPETSTRFGMGESVVE